MITIPLPYQVNIVVTRKCNLRCIHCYIKEYGNINLSYSEIIKIIDQAKEMCLFKLTFEGGEPFLREDIFAIIQYANMSGIQPLIATNGTLVNKSIAFSLRKLDVSIVQVSLDGSCPEIHDQIRGENTFSKAIEGIHNLIEVGIPVRINFVLMKQNAEDLESMIALAISLKVNGLRVLSVVDFNENSMINLDLNESKEIMKKLYNYKLKFKEKIDIIPVINGGNLTSIHRGKNLFSWTSNYATCWAGYVSCAIDADGFIYPCTFLINTEYKVGNINNDSLASIWEKSPLLNDIRSSKYPVICKYCIFRKKEL